MSVFHIYLIPREVWSGTNCPCRVLLLFSPSAASLTEVKESLHIWTWVGSRIARLNIFLPFQPCQVFPFLLTMLKRRLGWRGSWPWFVPNLVSWVSSMYSLSTLGQPVMHEMHYSYIIMYIKRIYPSILKIIKLTFKIKTHSLQFPEDAKPSSTELILSTQCILAWPIFSINFSRWINHSFFSAELLEKSIVNRIFLSTSSYLVN